MAKAEKRSKNILPLTLFCFLYILFCLFTYKHFAITADENFRYSVGKEFLAHYLNPNARDYTIATPVDPTQPYLYTGVLNLFNPNFYYEQFHLLNMLAALPIFIAVYILIYSQCKNKWLALLGPTLLFFVPSFSGHIPANPIDVPFATAFMISLLLIYLLRDKKVTPGVILMLGIAFGITQTLRFSGFMIYIIYILFTLYYFRASTPNEKSSSLKHTALFLLRQLPSIALIFVCANFFMLLFWPFIGLNYFRNMLYVLSLHDYYTMWNKTFLFMGKFITPNLRPWYYLPTYIFLTTPLYILGSYIASFFPLKKFEKNPLLVLLGISVAVPMALYLIMNPIIYNGLRHFLFLIPIITTAAVIKIVELVQSIKSKKTKTFSLKGIALLLISIDFSYVLVSMVQLHPYEYAFFNELTNGIKGAHANFETEYWGASYKEATEWVRDHYVVDNKPLIKVFPCNLASAVDYYSYKRFETTILRSEANLIICEYEKYIKSSYMGMGQIIYTVKRNGVSLNYVIKIK